ncbi:carboxypeptidase-like regulatory domain-containing protein [Aquimarina celericrescens]|nr:carboxypeptidase-like regulatory domain-containing protein [Aquimarina celericrescens]
MLKRLLLLTLLLLSGVVSAQVVGEITDTKGEKLPYVNIYLENSFTGTTSNQEGNYELEISQPGDYTIVYQFLGYKTQKKQANIQSFPYTINVSLAEESTSLEEVVINSDENPADRVIRKAIANRKKNLAKVEAYTADFYSRGIWKIENAPEKILGQEVGDLGGGLDSTRSGIVYLSETKSKIKFKAPDDFHEKIIASKVSGDDNGFSLNSAQDADFTFYNNTIELNAELVSPIADYAFNYYDYKLEGIFYDDLGNLVNKIKVIPKRPKDRVFSGTIYILEDSWEIYGIELTTTGESTQITPIETLVFKQNFTYSEKDELWVKLSQTVEFTWKIFGIGGNGRFSAVYSDYDFNPQFTREDFSNEILSFAENANEKDSMYWEKIRPIPLTTEEVDDYIRKDSIQERKNSRVYKDSVDQVRNKFKITDPLFGYSYRNSFKQYSWNISGPIEGIRYNTVQGWNTTVNANFTKWEEDYNKYWGLNASANYGLADDRLRVKGGFIKKFNNKSKPYFTLNGGIEAKQINDTEPISTLVSSVASILFDKNYLKIYDRTFVEARYSEEIFNGFRLYANASFERRSALFDDPEIIEDEDEFTANNPLAPNDFDSTPFEDHNIAKIGITGRINFDQKYYNYPDGKYNVTNSDYPTLYFSYEKGFAATVDDYNFDHFKVMANQRVSLQNKGDFEYSLKGGKFLNGENISLVDHQHFNGNLTHVKLDPSINQFNLLPYYGYSANDTYGELHAEHNFKGYLLGKIPLLRSLNFNTVIGVNSLWTTGNKPYSEYSVGISNIGFGKYRILRVDYVKAYQGGWQDSGVMFGLSIGM